MDASTVPAARRRMTGPRAGLDPAAARVRAGSWTQVPVVAVFGVGAIRIAELLGTPPPPLRRPVVVSSLGSLARLRADLVILASADSPAADVRALALLPGPAPSVLVLTRTAAPREVLDCLRTGASSYLVDGQYTRGDLVAATLDTLAGRSHLSPSAIAAVVRATREDTVPAEHPTGAVPLSDRQREILGLLADGLSNSDIAARLHLAEKTVRNQISAIYAKLPVRSRAEAILYWLGRAPDAGQRRRRGPGDDHRSSSP
jgi:DNA-binding NarL/FixJ family response regulator